MWRSVTSLQKMAGCPPHSYQCILIKTGILNWKNLTLKSICSYVENFIPAACAVEHRGNVVVYINLDLCDFTLDEISQKLGRFYPGQSVDRRLQQSDAGTF